MDLLFHLAQDPDEANADWTGFAMERHMIDLNATNLACADGSGPASAPICMFRGSCALSASGSFGCTALLVLLGRVVIRPIRRGEGMAGMKGWHWTEADAPRDARKLIT